MSRVNIWAMLFKTPIEIMQDISVRIRQRRLALNLSQQGLSNQSGVSLGSIKRFEHSGHISLKSLLKMALVLDCLSDFDVLIQPIPTPRSLDTLLSLNKQRKKGTNHGL